MYNNGSIWNFNNKVLEQLALTMAFTKTFYQEITIDFVSLASQFISHGHFGILSLLQFSALSANILLIVCPAHACRSDSDSFPIYNP